MSRKRETANSVDLDQTQCLVRINTVWIINKNVCKNYRKNKINNHKTLKLVRSHLHIENN